MKPGLQPTPPARAKVGASTTGLQPSAPATKAHPHAHQGVALRPLLEREQYQLTVLNEQVKDPAGNPQRGDDLVTAACFDSSGQLYACGRQDGMVYVYRRDPTGGGSKWDFSPIAKFQAYSLMIDTLISEDIRPRLKDMKFLRRWNDSGLLLTANDKQIKLWKIQERQRHIVTGVNLSSYIGTSDTHLEVPHLIPTERAVEHRAKRQFAQDHEYAIHSLSVSSEGEAFLSADDLTVRLWDVAHSDTSLKLLDIRPTNLEELTETITVASFSQQQCMVMGVGTSRGLFHVGDLRQALTCERYSLTLDGSTSTSGGAASVAGSPAQQALADVDAYYYPLTASITGAEFSPAAGDRRVVTRDYLTVKIWDMTMPTQPVHVVPVHDWVKPRLQQLCEADVLYDRFETRFSPDGQYVMTGTYRYEWVCIDSRTGESTVHCRAGFRGRRPGPSSLSNGAAAVANNKKVAQVSEEMDGFWRRSHPMAVYPKGHTVAFGNGSETAVYCNYSATAAR